MAEKYIIQGFDIIFVIIIILLLRTKLPVWLILMSSFSLYYFYLTYFLSHI